MDVLIYHREVEEGDFPDCCVCCGAGDTALTAIVLTTAIPVFGGPFQYQEVSLPFCPEHARAPLVSFNYPAARRFTEEGVVVKNVAPEFVDALEQHRERTRRRRRRGEVDPAPPRRAPQAGPARPSPERERAYRLFIIGCIVAALLGGAAIGGIVILVGPKGKNVPAASRPQPPDQRGRAP
jgi:hypothetical protein